MKVVKLLSALVLLAVLALCIYIYPAHQQIRQVRPPLPDTADLEALLKTRDAPISVHWLNTSSQMAPGRNLHHPAYLLTWRDGKHFMIDAGMDEPTAMEFGELLEIMWDADKATFHGSVIDQLGTAAIQLKGVGFTHLHIDHTQGIQAACANQPNFVVIQTTHQQQLQNRNTVEGAEIVRACPGAPTLEGTRLTQVPGFPGLALYSLGGHTPGSTLFVAAVQNRLLLFSGDTTNPKANLLTNTGKGFLYSYILVPEDTERTARLRAWLADLDGRDNFTVVVAHDLDRSVADLGTLLQPWQRP